MNKKSLTLVALAALASFVGAQQVQITSDGRPERLFRPARGLDREDAKFLKEALAADQFELMASKIALNHGTGDFTHEYAKEMILDHGAAKDEAIQTAENRGVATNVNLPQPLQAEINHLRNLQGDAFDHAFRDIQEQGHEHVIHLFEKEIQDGHDDLVKAMAVKELPEIELHYKLLLAKQTMMGDTAATHGM
jgi:putative membrane protein